MRLNNKITIQKLKKGIDDEGFNYENWIDHYKCWSNFRTVGWREYYSAKAIQAENTVTFTIRYSKTTELIVEDVNCTKNYRILYKDKTYDIKCINDVDNKHEYIDIKAECLG